MIPKSYQLKHKIVGELQEHESVDWNDKWNNIWRYFRRKTCNEIIIPLVDETKKLK